MPYKNICFVSEHPIYILRDEQNRLHSLEKAAITYADGFSVYAVHGVRVNEDIILNPESITIEQIENEDNVEIKRVMIDRYGYERYLTDSNAILINKDEFGELYRKEIENDEPLVMVKVINSTAEPDGTFKNYFLRVPPECKTAYEAVGWTFGFDDNRYNPVIET